MAKTTRAVAVFLGIAAVAAGITIARRPSRAVTAVTDPSAGAIPRGGTLVASLRSEPTSYNRYVDQSAAGELISLLTQAPLVRVNRTTDTLEPWLAESWSESEDGRAYTLKLRDGVTFSDGTPFSSADVLFSFAALYRPQSQFGAGLGHLRCRQAALGRSARPAHRRDSARIAVGRWPAPVARHPHAPETGAAGGARSRRIRGRVAGQFTALRDRGPRPIRPYRAHLGPAPDLLSKSPLLAQGHDRRPASVPRHADGPSSR